MGDYNCLVIQQTQITEDIYHIVLKANEIARDCSPGQFVHMRISEKIDPLLRRPFSIHRVDRQKGQIELLYRIVGQGTTLLQKAKSGDFFQVMGPLGKGFSLNEDYTTALVVVGGMGVAPAFFLMDELIGIKKQVVIYWGAKSGSEMFGIKELETSGIEIHLATEDGSQGSHGLVTDSVQTFLDQHSNQVSLSGFVCGPKALLQKVQAMSFKSAFEWQASLEERMACGIGICQGCAVKLKKKGFCMVCSEGPVFDLKEVEFDG